MKHTYQAPLFQVQWCVNEDILTESGFGESARWGAGEINTLPVE